MTDLEEVVVGIGEITKIEKVPARAGEVSHTRTLVDFGEGSRFLLPSNYSDSPVKQLTMKTDLLKYGKQYEVVLREVKPKTAQKNNARLIRTEEEAS